MTLVRTVGDVNGDPIDVVGMGCRFPGGITSADELWQAVIDEHDLVSAAPVDRGWSQNGWRGGFLDGAAEFDEGFFGISARGACYGSATACAPRSHLGGNGTRASTRPRCAANWLVCQGSGVVDWTRPAHCRRCRHRILPDSATRI